MPEPASEQLFHGGERRRIRVVGWSSCPFKRADFAQPPLQEPDTNVPFTSEPAAFVATTIRRCICLWLLCNQSSKREYRIGVT